ncbi:peptidase inhibitor 16-like isoform X2 [Conger conger]|nr:peptidase inhibitor 16-like isoform X2 [Conger conger]
MAAGYVTKCVWEHNPDLKDAGENLYATNGPFSASQAVTGWYLEHLDYSYHNDTCEEDKLCGHYTQVVWSHTTFVGCSTHLCEEVAGLTLSHVTLLVCNYFPPGNYEGVLPYEEGEPCSNCPNDLHCEGNICVDEPPSATEGTTEGPQPGTDGPSITESPAMETDKSPVAETDGSPTAETDGSPTAETEESASPSDFTRLQVEFRGDCEGNIYVDEPPSATEGTTEGPQPGTDGPSITESPAMETDKSPVAETDGSPTAETDGSPTAETDGSPTAETEESASPSDESLHDTDTGERDEGWENRVQSVAGPMPHCSSALLFVTLVLLTL